jgi:hypothetical protein
MLHQFIQYFSHIRNTNPKVNTSPVIFAFG